MRVGEGRREEESCVFALALALPIFPPQNSTLELLTECVFCLRNLGNGWGGGLLGKLNIVYTFLHSLNYIMKRSVCTVSCRAL